MTHVEQPCQKWSLWAFDKALTLNVTWWSFHSSNTYETLSKCQEKFLEWELIGLNQTFGSCSNTCSGRRNQRQSHGHMKNIQTLQIWKQACFQQNLPGSGNIRSVPIKKTPYDRVTKVSSSTPDSCTQAGSAYRLCTSTFIHLWVSFWLSVQ